MRTIWQIFAIARTEFRFGLRRGAPVVVTALIGLILGAALLLDPIANLQFYNPSLDQFPPEKKQAFIQAGVTEAVFHSLERDGFADLTAGSAQFSWFFIFLALIFLPVAAIGAIPADHSFGVWELFRSLPIKGNTYLVGKILGLSVTVAFIGIFPLALFFALLEGILLAHFQVGIPWGLLKFYLELALLDGIPILFFSVAVGALAGVVFRSRRAAILPGFALGLVSLLFWKAAFKAPPVTFYQFDLAAYYVFQGYHSLLAAAWARIRSDFPALSNPLLGAGAPFVGIIQVLLMYLAILVVLAGVFSLAGLWLKWKEGLS
jgi:ABC-type transport system involved in multi-copper enzyme maturation permease subunit